MIYKEIKGDLFSVPEYYYLAHCISADFALGAGIAKQFDKLYDMRDKLNKYYLEQKYQCVGKALMVGKVFNLVTKQRCWQKPTYDTLCKSLMALKLHCMKLEIKKLAMPKIASGLDRLDWNRVSEIVKEIFNDMDMEIKVYYL